MQATAAPRPIIGRALVWVRRYLPAELIGTATALLCALVAAQLGGGPAATALAATWGEILGFYGLMAGREAARVRSLRAAPAAVARLVLEFGPAELLDSFALRPALMYAGLTLAPSPALGLIAGKLAADVVFYIPTIVSFELLQARRAGEEGER
jgi:hypothetical protein